MIEDSVIYHHRVDAASVPVDMDETYRYMGFARSVVLGKDGGIPQDIQQLVASCVQQMHSTLKAQSVYTCLPLEIDFPAETSEKATDSARTDVTAESTGEERAEKLPLIKIGSIQFESKYLARNLAGCSKVILIASTIGPLADNLIRRFTKLDAAKAAIMQAAGAMFIESYLDSFNAQLEKEAEEQGYKLHSRFSPGYGDVSLEIQRHFFSILPCTQRIGLTLTDSLVMAPEKSVTAFIGMEKIS